jgi:uncharacterized protein
MSCCVRRSLRRSPRRLTHRATSGRLHVAVGAATSRTIVEVGPASPPPGGRERICHEEDLPAQQPAPGSPSRLPPPHEHAGGPSHPAVPALEGPQAALRLTAARRRPHRAAVHHRPIDVRRTAARPWGPLWCGTGMGRLVVVRPGRIRPGRIGAIEARAPGGLCAHPPGWRCGHPEPHSSPAAGGGGCLARRHRPGASGGWGPGGWAPGRDAATRSRLPGQRRGRGRHVSVPRVAGLGRRSDPGGPPSRRGSCGHGGPSVSRPTRVLIRLVEGYQGAFAWRPSPCRFVPSCSNYALEALEVHGARRGSWLALRRLGRCHPWGAHGADRVPPRKVC